MTHTNDYPTEAYLAILETAAAVGMPTMFCDDLTQHDRNRLCGSDAPEVFGWVLRSSGTLLLDARMSDAHMDGYRDHVEVSGRDGDDRYFAWDGGKLTEHSLAGGMFAAIASGAGDPGTEGFGGY